MLGDQMPREFAEAAQKLPELPQGSNVNLGLSQDQIRQSTTPARGQQQSWFLSRQNWQSR